MVRDNNGKFSKTLLKDRFWDKVKKTEGCWLWIGTKDRKSYGIIHESLPSKKSVLAHRLSYEFSNGEIQKGLVIMHKCDNPSCVNPDHLIMGTQHDNIHDMIRKGRKSSNIGNQIGIKNPSAKLNEQSVLKIREIYITKTHTQLEMSKMFNVSVPLIEKIIARKVWKHV